MKFHKEELDKELCQNFKRFYTKTSALRETDYFIKLVYHHFMEQAGDSGRKKKRVAVLGNSFPKEITCALGPNSRWILGGSPRLAALADSHVPRDTDDTTRGILGELSLAPEDEDILYVLPVSGDGSRKLSYLLGKLGKKVQTVEIPPAGKNHDKSLERYCEQMEQCVWAVERHLGHRITAASLKKSILRMEKVNGQIRLFQKITDDSDVLSGAMKLFVSDSFYYSSNIEEWCKNMEILNRRLSKQLSSAKERTSRTKPRVLLLGSPVFFPNYKIPFLIEDAGLYLHAELSGAVPYKTEVKMQGIMSAEKIVRQIAEDFYRQEMSCSYAVNQPLKERLEQFLETEQIDGAIYHVLKGHIAYDFEREQCEKILERRNIPLFRLETDYKYNDVEQLRIRLEAFAEMLQHKTRRK